MDREIYLHELEELEKCMNAVPNSICAVQAKVSALMAMNLRCERVAFDRKLTTHPYILTQSIIHDTRICFEHLAAVSFAETAGALQGAKSTVLEEKHEELWQEIWSRHNDLEYREFVDLKLNRLKINHLVELVKNSRCVDFGCGNGSFSVAALEAGACWVTGIDFGAKSVRYAQAVCERLGYQDKTEFKVADVTSSGLADESFDFAISNGVFHHLQQKRILAALKEVARVLKTGGWFWYYIDGKGAISMDLWDTSVRILKDVNILDIERVLTAFNLTRNKLVHCMDGLSATYLHSGWDEATDLLKEAGFGEFSRLQGGAATDLDGENLMADPYASEKFGEGDLRILCRKVRNR